MEHVEKKYRAVDNAGMSTVLANEDWMAQISSFLDWPDIFRYVLVCKTWNHSFFTRPWGSPNFFCFRYCRSSINHNYVKFIKSAMLDCYEDGQIEVLKHLKLNALTLVCDQVDMCSDKIAEITGRFTRIELLHEIPFDVEEFLLRFADTLTDVDTSDCDAEYNLPHLPNLVKLSIVELFSDFIDEYNSEETLIVVIPPTVTTFGMNFYYPYFDAEETDADLYYNAMNYVIINRLRFIIDSNVEDLSIVENGECRHRGISLVNYLYILKDAKKVKILRFYTAVVLIDLPPPLLFDWPCKLIITSGPNRVVFKNFS